MLSRTACCAIVTLLITATLVGCGGPASSGGSGGGGGNNSTTVTFNFTGPAPTAVAAQIGSGAYSSATVNNNTATLSVPQGTTNFAFAYVCPSYIDGTYTLNYEVLVIASITDGTTYSEQCPSSTPAPPLGEMTGTIDASAINGATAIGFQTYESGYFFQDIMSTSQAQSFSSTFPTGTNDMLVIAEDSLGIDPLAIKEFPAQIVPGALNGGNPVTFGAADQTISENLTFNNVPAGTTINLDIIFTSATGNQFELSALSKTAYLAPPASLLTGNAAFQVTSAAAPEPANTPQEAVWTTLNAGAPVSFTFPTPWSCTVPTPAALPTFNLGSYTGFTGKNGVAMFAGLNWQPSQNVTAVRLEVE